MFRITLLVQKSEVSRYLQIASGASDVPEGKMCTKTGLINKSLNCPLNLNKPGRLQFAII
jgi:hypothetical protein